MDILNKIKIKPFFYKSVSILLSVVMILSVFTVSIIARADDPVIWDGSKISSLTEMKGSGTKDAPYEIENGSQLAYIVSTDLTDGLYYKLVKDIYLNDTSKENWKETARSWVWANVRFVGDFDGNGHTIDGLYYSGNDYRFGMFSYVGDSKIYNFKMTNAYINATRSGSNTVGVAFVAGQTSAATTFEQIYIDETCSIIAPNMTGVAAIVGRCNANATVKDCAVLGSISASGVIGSFLGKFDAGTLTITGSYSTLNYALNGSGTLKNSSNNYGLVADTFGTTVLTLDKMKGENAKTNMSSFDFENVWKTVKDSYPIFSWMTVEEDEVIEYWDGSKISSLTEMKGSGTKDAPYEIENGSQLAYIVSTDLTDGLYYKLVKDIYLNDTSKENWKETARSWVWANVRFVGDFDGNGHTIDGLYYSGNDYRFGMFSYVGDSKVHNFKMTNAYINATRSGSNTVGVAFVAGQTSAATTFEQIYIDETCSIIAPNMTGVAAIVGRCNANATVKDCAVLGSISASGVIGSFLGKFDAGTLTITGSYSTLNYALNGSGTLKNSSNNYGLVADQFGTTVLTLDKMKGENAKTNMSGFDFENVWKTVANKYPVFTWMTVEEGETPEEPENPEEPETPSVDIWDGTKISALTEMKGSGTEEAPYEIENGSQLAYVVSTNLDDGLYFKLVKDIYLNDTTKANWKDSARNWVWGNIRFVGNFDGQGHTIDGLYYNASKDKFGLFSYVGDSEIKNIKITNAHINNGGANGVAILVGQTSADTVFEGIYIDETCTLNAPNAAGVAGITAHAYKDGSNYSDVTISNSAVLANITGGTYVSAFIGKYAYGNEIIKINNSFAASNVGFTPNRALTDSKNNYTLVSDTASGAVVLTADQMKGNAAKENMTGLDFDTVFEVVDGKYPIINLREKPRYDIWDGTKISSLSEMKGSGTEAAPYEIENGKQLAYVVSTNLDDGLYFKLVKDIYLNDTTKANWKDSARNWVWGNIRFVGNFDGQGHTIDGLYYNASKDKFGLFSYVGDSEIKNIKITNAHINNGGANGVAILVGQTSADTVFEGIYIDETCTLNAPNAAGVAGITAHAYKDGSNYSDVTITNSAVLANITGGTYVSAFIGKYAYGNEIIKINNSFAASNVGFTPNRALTNSNNIYTLVADTASGAVVLTADQMKGNAAKENMSGLDFDNVFEVVDGKYPIINIRGSSQEPEEPDTPVVPTNPDVWDGTKISSLSEMKGSGTEDAPYEIENGKQLAYVVSTNLDDGLYFKLVKDIKLNDTTIENWKNYARNWVWGDIRFVGNFDGDGHTIDGLYYNGAKKKFGLFSYVGDSLIKNVKITNASITNTEVEGVGILVGQTSAATVFDTIYIDETCELNAPNAKGVAGIAPWGSVNVTITNSAVLAKITGSSGVGALAGEYWGGTLTITDCFSTTNLPLSGKRAITNPLDNYALVGDTYATTVLTADQMKGEAAKTNMSGLDFNTIFQTVEGKYPIINLREGQPGDEPIDPIEVWDGKIAENFAGGSGTSADPYIIENGGQLYKMVAEFSNVSATDKTSAQPYFKITKDINLGNKQWYTTTVTSWLDNAAYSSIGFNGIIDGGGHTIKGLYNAKAAGAVGLIPVATQGAEIHNLHLENGNLPRANWQTYACGAFIGLAKGANGNTKPIIIKGCTVKNFDIGSCNGTGGFVGYVYSQSVGIYNSRCVGTKLSHTAESSANSAGFIGYTNGNDYLNTIVVANSYCTDVSPIPYLNEKFKAITTFSNVYTNYVNYDNSFDGCKKLTTEQMKGENAKQNMEGFDFVRSWTTVENDYPIHYLYVRPDYVWDGSKAEEFAGGTGTPADPYLISNGAQLYKMVSEYSNASGDSGTINSATYFKLTNDIYLNDVTANDLENPTDTAWNSIFNSWYSTTSYSKGFCGDLDGDGFTVYGLYCNKGYAGLIPVLMDGGSVHNLNIKDSYIYGTESAGGLVGFVKAHWKMAPVSVSYCTVDNVVVESTKRFVGGVIGGFGDLKITVNDCSVTRSTLKSTADNPNLVSGFIGYGWGNLVQKVTNCFTDSSVNPVSATTDKEQYDSLAGFFTYTNVYTTADTKYKAQGVTYLSKDDVLKGENAVDVLKGFNFDEDWTIVENNYPAIQKNAGDWQYDVSLPGVVWSGKTARSYSSGNGSENAPYEIATAGQLALLAQDALNGKTLGRYYVITQDIVVNDTSKENWQSTAKEWFTGAWAQSFRGHLDGGYHTISGLYLNKTKYNYSGSNYYGGLFANLGPSAVIEKLGIVNSSLTFTTGNAYVGAFAGFIEQYNSDDVTSEQYPIIRECFADTTVSLESDSCGGFIGCATRPIRVEDSFFTGKVAVTSRGLFGYSKMNKTFDEVFIKNFYVADSKYAILSNVSYDNFKYENCYSSSAQDTAGTTRLFIDKMVGKNAKDNMKGLDFDKVWAVRGENETPGLKGFDPDSFSNVMNPSDIVISFETNCDIQVEAITGKAYSKLTLPVLEREGYKFEGWYAYAELDVPYNYDYYPTFDTILYAKWTLNGFTQGFENYEDSIYDYHEDYEYYRPTVAGYSAKYAHGGGKSMHRIGASGEDLDFLLMYDEELVVGRKYKMTFYTTTDQQNASVDVSLVHLDWPDVYCANNGVEKIASISKLTDGDWVETTITFVARSKWIAIRTSGNNSVYFDDFVLYDIGKGTVSNLADSDDNEVDVENLVDTPEQDQQTGDDYVVIEPGDEEIVQDEQFIESKPDNMQVNKTQKTKNSMTVWYIVIAAASVICLGAVAFIIIILVKRKRK